MRRESPERREKRGSGRRGDAAPAFSLVEILVASAVCLCLLLPLYFLFTSTSRGVETSVRQLEAVTYATEVMSQMLGVDEQGVRLFVKGSTTDNKPGEHFCDLEAKRKKHGDKGIPMVVDPWIAMVKSRIHLSEVPEGFRRSYRIRRIATDKATFNYTPANLVELAVQVEYPRPGAKKPSSYVLTTFLSRPAAARTREELGLE